MSKDRDREDKLAAVLDEAGLLAPLMKVATEDVAQRRGSVVSDLLRESFPDLSDEKLDELAREF
jgi:hypothetical protein